MSLRRSSRLATNVNEQPIEIESNPLKRKIKQIDTISEEQSETINYYSYFFRKDIVNDFERELNNKISILKQENPNFKTPMDYYKIYNLDSVLEYCGTKTTYNLRSNPQNEEERKNQIQNLKKFLANEICSDIGESYAEKAVEKAFEKKEFDIAVLATSQMEENIKIDEDEDISESQLTEYSQTTQYEDYGWLLGKEIKDNTKDDEYKPQDYKKQSLALRNNNLFKYRTSSIKAFIIVELGECNLYPKAFSVNLICAKKGDTTNIFTPQAGAFSGSGNILMGLYLYSILSHPQIGKMTKQPLKFPLGQASILKTQKKFKITEKSEYIVPEESEIDIDEIIFNEPLINVQHIAVLELAGAYKNPGGLCSYEKYGYHFDDTLYDDSCFNDYNNLPMIIDFNKDYEGDINSKKMRIINIAAGNKSYDFKKSMICNVRDKVNQVVLGFLKSYKIFIDKGIDLDDFNVKISTKLNQLLMYLNRGREVTVDNIINYIENFNQSQTKNEAIEKIIKNIYDNLGKDFKRGGKKTKKRNLTKKVRNKKYIIKNKIKSKKSKKIQA
jgi:hypothetical protein